MSLHLNDGEVISDQNWDYSLNLNFGRISILWRFAFIKIKFKYIYLAPLRNYDRTVVKPHHF